MEVGENKKFNLKKIFVGITFLFTITLIIYLQISGKVDIDSFSMYIQSHGYFGWLSFVLIYALGTLFAFPGSILTLIAGFVFDSLVGFVLVLIGASIGALLAFLISRYLFHDYFHKKFAHAKFLKYTKTENQKNLTSTIFFMRLLPIFPFNALNYGYGLTKITAGRYFLATLFGIMPGVFVWVFLGSSLKDVFSLKFAGAVVLMIVFAYVVNKLRNRIRFKKSGKTETNIV